MATKRLDINTASIDELTQLPMIDEQRAHTLAEQRPFHDWLEVENCPASLPAWSRTFSKKASISAGQGEEMKYAWEQEEELEP